VIWNSIEVDKAHQAELADPTTTKDVNELIDRNLEQIIASSEIYQEVDIGVKKKK